MNDVRELDPLATPDGRTLTLCEAGDANGLPVVYLHGTSSSRLEIALYAEVFGATGLRLVAWDRPGHGGSTFQPGRTLRDAATDLRVVLDALNIERPVVAGLSGGGSHVLALAVDAADVLSGAIAINPGAPGEEPFLTQTPRTIRFAMRAARDNPSRWERLAKQTDKEPGPVLKWLSDRLVLDAQDRRVLAQPEVRAAFERAGREGKRQRGTYAFEGRLLWARPWGVDPAMAGVPVHIFSGLRDPFAGYARNLSERGAELHRFPGGHFSGYDRPVVQQIATVALGLLSG